MEGASISVIPNYYNFNPILIQIYSYTWYNKLIRKMKIGVLGSAKGRDSYEQSNND